jgi:hypothetical protein
VPKPVSPVPDANNKRKRDDASEESNKKAKGGEGGPLFDLSSGALHEEGNFELSEAELEELSTHCAKVRLAVLMACEIARAASTKEGSGGLKPDKPDKGPRIFAVVRSLFALLSQSSKKLDFVLLLLQLEPDVIDHVFPSLHLPSDASCPNPDPKPDMPEEMKGAYKHIYKHTYTHTYTYTTHTQAGSTRSLTRAGALVRPR